MTFSPCALGSRKAIILARERFSSNGSTELPSGTIQFSVFTP